MDDLDRLIEAVESGGEQPTFADQEKHFGDGCLWEHMPTGSFATNELCDILEAYNGDLSASQRLHDALLPGWHVAEISEAAFPLDHDGKHWLVAVAERAGKGMSEANGPTMARAWLLAILKALKAKGAA